MKRTFLLCTALAGLSWTFPATAQDGNLETVVVSGFRSSIGESLPFVVVTRRADHVYTSITIENDTRDAKQRLEELRQSLRAVLVAVQQEPRITLSVETDSVLKPFTEDLIDSYITNGSRPDTSRARILVKTAIAEDDTFESTTGRIEAFIKRIPRIGRSDTLNDADWEIAVVGPQQYHATVIAKIAANAKDTAAQFGPDYGVTVEGLYRPLQWYRAGQLDLALYIPYTMVVQPK